MRSLRDVLATNSWCVAICVLVWTPLCAFLGCAAEETSSKAPVPKTVILRHAIRVYAVAFSPDGKTVLTGSEDWTARLWDAATGEPVK